MEQAAFSGSGWGVALPVLAEFFCVATHSQATGRPSTAVEARRFIQALVEGGKAQIWVPGIGLGERLMTSAAKLGVSGARILDLQIALIAREAGARELWTHDSNFLVPPGIRVVDPLEA